MTVRIGLIGAGIMGSDHARIFATQIPGVTLQYICDADANRLKTIANETGAKHTATDPLAVINSKDVDAIVIASPDETHAPLTLAAIALGKPVLCEKPLSPSSAECLNVIAAEVKIGKRLAQIGFMRRFDPSYVEMKSILKSDALGAPLMMHNFHRNVSAPSNFTGQMAISNSAPHEFDIARWVLETEYKSINVFRPKLADPTKTGAPVFMVLETVAGQLVNIEINNNAAYGYDVSGELVGEKGTVSLQNNNHSLTRVNLKQNINFPADWRPRFAEAYRLQNAAWIISIQTGTPAGASAWDGYAATLVAEAGVQSLLQKKPIMVSSVARPDLY
jgi:myo-inositol 2-dehydrogenase / D-chiro-inositol 1-dehydrogenase